MTQREKRINDNLGLVHSCAQRFKNRGVEYEDLFQAGCIGLIKAADNFDSGNNNVFRAVMRKLCNVKKVVDNFAHHFAGVVFVIIAEGKFLIMVKQILTHIAFHSCTHNMSPAGNKILTAKLYNIHGKQNYRHKFKGSDNLAGRKDYIQDNGYLYLDDADIS